MPIYGYVCKHCEHTLDVLQKISDDPLVDCPECGEPQLKRQLSAPRFRLKGTGWYETDFKDKKPKKDEKTSSANKTETKTSSDSEKKASKSDDNKSSAPASSTSKTKDT